MASEMNETLTAKGPETGLQKALMTEAESPKTVSGKAQTKQPLKAALTAKGPETGQ
jgi:hypothetical protein